ncbi:MAG: hypothetical protein AB7U63_03160 [Porticoccaceae bacterium]
MTCPVLQIALSYRLVFRSVALVVILGSGCASNPGRQAEETFATHLSADGVRYFDFTVELPQEDGHHRRPPPRDNGSFARAAPGSAIADPHKLAAIVKPKVLEQLHLKLEETGYCPEGYTLIESQYGRTSVIRGRCVALDGNQRIQ